MNANNLLAAIVLVVLQQVSLHGQQITNGDPFDTTNSNVVIEEIWDGSSYVIFGTDQNDDPLFEGGYNWNDTNGVATGGPNFNYDRTVVELAFDFSSIQDFNPNGANLNIRFDWTADPNGIQNGQDKIFTHAYDIRNLPNGVDLLDYINPDQGLPPDSYFDYHSGVVNSQSGNAFAVIMDDGNGNRVPVDDILVDIDLTDLTDPGTRIVKIQVEYVDPDLNDDVGQIAISQFTLNWNPVPEPSGGTLLLLIAIAGAGVRTRRPRR